MAKRGTVSWLQTNVANSVQARALISAVIGERVAACANVWPINSEYWWEGKRERAREVAVHFKTTPTALPKLVALVQRFHPYKTPYIEWGRAGEVDPRYAAWVTQEAVGHRPGIRRRT